MSHAGSLSRHALHYEVTGHGRPLVLTIPLSLGPQARAALVAAFAVKYRVLTYDSRGTGRSGPAKRQQTIEAFADDLYELMKEADFENAVVVGLSTGTGVATALAANYQDRVSHLVLAAPWTHGDADLHVLQNIRKAAARTMPPDAYSHFNTLLIYPPDYRRQRFERFNSMALQACVTPQDPVLISARLDAILAFDARPLYSRIECPALVMGARDDLIMPCWFAQEAAAALPRARLVLFDQGGHLFAETRSADFVKEVNTFIDEG